MAKRRNRQLDYAVYLLARLSVTLLGLLSESMLYGLAAGAGRAMFRLDRKHRRIARAQIASSFPDWPSEQVDRVARESFQSLVMLGVEMLMIPRWITPQRWRRHVRLTNVGPLIGKLVEHDRPVILLTGHFGNWEVAPYTMATLGLASVSVARPLDNPFIDRFIRDVRQRTGQRVVDKTGATAEVPAVLADNGAVGFVADQDAGRKGVFVDYFDRPASTFRSVALLARSFEAPIVVASARRTGQSFQFEVRIERIIEPAEWRDRDDEIRWITQTYTSALEQIVRRDPGQYFGWLHRRWKHRPDGTLAPDGLA